MTPKPEAYGRWRSGQSFHCHRLPDLASNGQRALRISFRTCKLPPLWLALCARHEGVSHDLVACHNTAVMAPSFGEMCPHFRDRRPLCSLSVHRRTLSTANGILDGDPEPD